MSAVKMINCGKNVFFCCFFFLNVILLISGMLKVRSESRHLAQYLIPATAP